MKKKTTAAEATGTKRGRPVLKNSARQIRLAAQAKIIAKGGTIKRGRPAGKKTIKTAKPTKPAPAPAVAPVEQTA